MGVCGSAGSLQALRDATEMSRHFGVPLMPVLAWTPPGGELADRRYPSAELRALWQQSAWERLWHAVDLAIGGPPADIAFVPKVARGAAGDVLTRIASKPGDILVIGTGRHGAVRRLLACNVSRYCLAHAACPVMAVPPSELAVATHGLHGWFFRHRVHPEDAGLPPRADRAA